MAGANPISFVLRVNAGAYRNNVVNLRCLRTLAPMAGVAPLGKEPFAFLSVAMRCQVFPYLADAPPPRLCSRALWFST